MKARAPGLLDTKDKGPQVGGKCPGIFRYRGSTIPINLVLTLSAHLTTLIGNATSIILWALSPNTLPAPSQAPSKHPPSRVRGVQAAQKRR